MGYSIKENAYAVLLPAFDGLKLSDGCKRYLDHGGLSILLGESRAEYVARGMTADRRATERTEDFLRITSDARARAGDILVAVDQEPGGICRLHDLVPAYPEIEAFVAMPDAEIEARAAAVGRSAAELGVNVFLAPILDTLIGPNPWLQGRTVSSDAAVVARFSAAFVRGLRQAGIRSVAKHFPGYPQCALDPAIHSDAQVETSLDRLQAGLQPFEAVIAEGVDAMMVGPAIVAAYDPDLPALRSERVIKHLTGTMGFRGLVMADDLDSAATLRGNRLEQVAVQALNSGCDWLLLADIDDHLDLVARAIVEAVHQKHLGEEQLARSAAKLRSRLKSKP
ncbi:glycoside hydrolase family 3 N-terminal domain-containing protein [Arenibacterium sp. LLYu02]|uniref:glycoside hydrolase family 3 N-terminal domain-containing protein n=1 Tax=Arenibacterium sp. LLYu02 TaxID=3404132 RepID=UPI003B22095E